jgi:hypothetical protein
MAPSTIGAIALRPTGNQQGSYYFYNLKTGRLLNCTHWTELPMPNDVISCIHKLSCQGHQGLEFLNCNGQPFIYPHTIDYPDNNPDDDDNSLQSEVTAGDAPNLDIVDITGVYNDAGYNAADNYNLDPDNAHSESFSDDDDTNNNAPIAQIIPQTNDAAADNDETIGM